MRPQPRWLSALAVAAVLVVAGAARAGTPAASTMPIDTLRVCADPSNLPYSDIHEAGFENRIASLLAQDLHAGLRYVWSMQRRGFLRRTLQAGSCDVVMSVPDGLDAVAVTRPWFTSSYVLVTRRAGPLHPASFDDPALPSMRIGLQLVGAEGANTPPTLSLARRGIVGHVTGFPMWAAESVDNPQGRIIDAVAQGDIDVAIVWGPFAGYFARPYGARLLLTPLGPDRLLPAVAYSYGMAVGVRHGDEALRTRLQAALDRHTAEIGAILAEYAVPIAAPLR